MLSVSIDGFIFSFQSGCLLFSLPSCSGLGLCDTVESFYHEEMLNYVKCFSASIEMIV